MDGGWFQLPDHPDAPFGGNDVLAFDAFVTLVTRVWRDDGSDAVQLYAVNNGNGFENLFMRNTQTFKVTNVPVAVYEAAQIAVGLLEGEKYLAGTPQGNALVDLVGLSEGEIVNMQSVGDVAFSFTVGGEVDGNYSLLPFAGWQFGAFTRFVSHPFTLVWPHVEQDGTFVLRGDAPADNHDCLPSALAASFSSLTLRAFYPGRKAEKQACTVDTIRTFIEKPVGCLSFNDVKPYLEFHRLGVVVYDVGARCRLNWKHLGETRNGPSTAYLLYHNKHIWPLSGNKKVLVQAHVRSAAVYAECETAPPRLPMAVQAGKEHADTELGEYPMARLLASAANDDPTADGTTMDPVPIHCLRDLELQVTQAVEQGATRLFARSSISLPLLFREIRDGWGYEPSIAVTHGRLRALHLRFNSSASKSLWVGVDCSSTGNLDGFGGDIPDADFKKVRNSVAALFPPALASTYNTQTLLPFSSAYSNGQVRRTICTVSDTADILSTGGAYEIDRRRAFTKELVDQCTGPQCIPVFDLDAGWTEVTDALTAAAIKPKSLYIVDASRFALPEPGPDYNSKMLQRFLLVSRPFSMVWGFALQRAIAIGMSPLAAVFGVLHPTRLEACNARKTVHELYCDHALHPSARKLAVNVVIGMTGSLERASSLAFFTTDRNEAHDLARAVQGGGGAAKTLFAVGDELGGFLVCGVGKDRLFTSGCNAVQSMIHGGARVALIEAIQRLPAGERDDWLLGVNADALLLRKDPSDLSWVSAGATTWENLGDWACVPDRRTSRLPTLGVQTLSSENEVEEEVVDEHAPVDVAVATNADGEDVPILPFSKLPPAYVPPVQQQLLPVFQSGVPVTMPFDADPWMLPGNVLICGVSGSGKTWKCLGGPTTPYNSGLVVACPTHDRRLGIASEFGQGVGESRRPVETTTIAALLGRAAPGATGGWTRAPYALLPHQQVVVEEAAWIADEDVVGLFGLMDRHPTVKWVWNLDWLQNTLSASAGPSREAQWATAISARFKYVIRLDANRRLTSIGDRLLHDALREHFLGAMANLARDMPVDWLGLKAACCNMFQLVDTLDAGGDNTVLITSNNLSGFIWNERVRGSEPPRVGERVVFRAKSQLQHGLINHRTYVVAANFGRKLTVRNAAGMFVEAARHCFRHAHAITGHLSQGSTYTFPHVVYAADLACTETSLRQPRDVARDARLLSFLYTALTRTTAFSLVQLYVGPSIHAALSACLQSDEVRDAFKTCNGVCRVCEQAFRCVTPEPMQLVGGVLQHLKCVKS